MNEPFRIGVLGCADVARRYLFPAIRNHPRFQLAFIGSRDPDQARRYTEQFGGRSGSYQDVIADPSLQAVYIPLPNALHAEWIERALRAGKHVLCEKPLTPSLEETARLCDLARQNRLLLMETFQFRFHAQNRLVRQWLAEGRLGELRVFRSSFGFPPFRNPSNIRYSRTLAGGALLDAGCYTLKAVSFFLGKGYHVQASTRWHPAGSEVDLGGTATLVAPDGRPPAQVAFGFDHFYQCSCEFWGNRGKLLMKRVFTAPPGFTPEAVLETPEGVQTIALPPDDHFAQLLTHFAHCIETGQFREEEEEILEQARLLEEIQDHVQH